MSLEGSQLGHYRLTHQIGSGGMGEIYLAEDTRIARQVAVKVVRNEPTQYPDANATQESTRLFRREMKAVASLDNPHILTLLDFGEETINRAAITYMVMPYRPEGSLNDWISQHPEKLSLEEINNIIQQAADALQHAHDSGIIHQDVKPSNFLIRSKKDKPNQPDLLLADFGIAKMLSATSTASQTSRGTATFMPPEQWDGNPVPATDQYALAIMAYQLLTGRPPFQGRMEQVMRQHFMTEPAPPSKLNSQLSPAVDAVLLRALAKKPEERFPSINDFANALQQALHYSDLRTTLTLTQAEAQNGLTRTIMLPGKRQVPVTVPANTQNGQVLYLNGQGGEYYKGGTRGPLIIQFAIGRSAPLPPQSQRETNSTSGPTPDRLAPTVAAFSTPTPSFNKTEPAPSPSFSNQVPVPPVPSMPQNSKPASTKPRSRARVLVLVGLVVIVIASSLISYGIYQNHLSQVKAANPYPSYFSGTGTLAFYDSLTQPDQWDNHSSSDGTGSCQFSSGSYHIQATSANYYSCNTSLAFSNFALEVQMTIVQGDCGGIVFSADSTFSKYYYYDICHDGSYNLIKYIGNQTPNTMTLIHNNSSEIHAGANQTNIIAVVATSNGIFMYANDQQVDSIQDASYSEGQIALVAYSYSIATDVSFSNARVWTL